MPAQIWLGEQRNVTADIKEVLWWRTYSPPIWLLDHNPLKTDDVMGMPFSSLMDRMQSLFQPECDPNESVGLVAPYSSLELDTLVAGDVYGLELKELWRYSRHLNLDDLDVAADGLWTMMRRVVGRRGLLVWRVQRKCIGGGQRVLQGDW